VRSLIVTAVLSAFCIAGVLAQGDQVYKLEPGNGVTAPVLIKEVKANYSGNGGSSPVPRTINPWTSRCRSSSRSH